MIFRDRIDAGYKLSLLLAKYKNKPDVVVLALPRGGVILGYEIAKELNLPLDIVVPRKIGAPGHSEFAIGAVAEDGTLLLDKFIIDEYEISQKYIDKEVEKEINEARRRLKLYRGGRGMLDVKGKIVILVDDGIATGMTMKAAIDSVNSKDVKQIIVAVPVASFQALEDVKQVVGDVVCLAVPPYFGAVGAFYENFGEVTDKDVIDIMQSTEKKIKGKKLVLSN